MELNKKKNILVNSILATPFSILLIQILNQYVKGHTTIIKDGQPCNFNLNFSYFNFYCFP
jgi:hypothetical protein